MLCEATEMRTLFADLGSMQTLSVHLPAVGAAEIILRGGP